jgi:hypothetical protein
MPVNEDLIETLESGRRDVVAAYETHLKKADEMMDTVPEHLIPTLRGAKQCIIDERDATLEALDLLIADAKN